MMNCKWVVLILLLGVLTAPVCSGDAKPRPVVETSAVVAPAGLGSGGALPPIIIEYVGFEGGTIPAGWVSTTIPPATTCIWAATDADAAAGSWSASAVAAGCGAPPLGPYPVDVSSALLYGPFSLSQALSAKVRFIKSTHLVAGDTFRVLRSLNGSNWSTRYEAPEGDQSAWSEITVNLQAEIGQPQVWLLFWLDSDSVDNGGGQVLIDEIYIEKTYTTADLAVTQVEVTSGTEYAPGDGIGLQHIVENLGGEASVNFDVAFYASLDTQITAGDLLLGSFTNLIPIGAGGKNDFTTGLTIPADLPDGTYYVGVRIALEDANPNNHANYDPVPIVVKRRPEIRIEPLVLEFQDVPWWEAFAGSSAVESQDAEKIDAASLTEIRAQAESQGRALVLVELATPFTPEGRLSASRAAAQRAGIASQARAVAAEMTRFNSPVRRQFTHLPYLALSVNANALEHLLRSPLIQRIFPDNSYAPSLASSTPVIGAPAAWAAGVDGSGWAVAVLDTGVDGTHPWFTTGGSRIVAEACFSQTIEGVSQSTCPGGVDTAIGPGAGTYCDQLTFPKVCEHGTHVSGIVAGNNDIGPDFGVARGANLIALQAFHESSPGVYLTFDSDYIAALDHVFDLADEHDIAAVNMSLGSGIVSTAPCDSHPAKAAIDNLRSVGIATVIATGNGGVRNAISRPACISTAISVGATSDADAVASFSNVAAFTSLMAPGVNITSSVPGGGTAAFNGTSMATPHVAATWAVIRQQNPDATVSEILEALRHSATVVVDQRSQGIYTDLRRINLDRALFDLAHSFQIFNDSVDGTLVVSSIEPDGFAPWISIDPPPPYVIPPQGSQTVYVSVDFEQTPDGPTFVRLLVNSDDPDENPYPEGVFIASYAIAPTSGFVSNPVPGQLLALPATLVGASSNPQVIAVHNPGDAGLDVTCLIGGDNPEQFVLDDCPEFVDRNGDGVITFHCAPTHEGTFEGILGVLTNAEFDPINEYPLTCVGITELPGEPIKADSYEGGG